MPHSLIQGLLHGEDTTAQAIREVILDHILIRPIREGRSPQQIGRKGVSNHRWIVGGKLCLLVNQYGAMF
jgi:hypothetical protein